MNEKTLAKLLCEQVEKDWFDFKEKLELYQSDGKLVERQRDELVKDILGLANGNSHIVRKTKYLIRGVDNSEFDEIGCRALHNVDYKTPSQSDLTIWLNNACTPSIVGIESEIVPIHGVNLFVITIPPTFELHETKRELITTNGNFTKYTVFMRQDEHTVPASVRDAITIRQLKYLHRQEISNPSPIWLGAAIGGIVAYIIGGAKVTVAQTNLETSGWFVKLILTALGVFFGSSTGFFIKQWNETRYDFRYMTTRQKIGLFVIIGISIFVVLLIFR